MIVAASSHRTVHELRDGVLRLWFKILPKNKDNKSLTEYNWRALEIFEMLVTLLCLNRCFTLLT